MTKTHAIACAVADGRRLFEKGRTALIGEPSTEVAFKLDRNNR